MNRCFHFDPRGTSSTSRRCDRCSRGPVYEAIAAFTGDAPSLARVMTAAWRCGVEPHDTVASPSGMASRAIWASVADVATVEAALRLHDGV